MAQKHVVCFLVSSEEEQQLMDYISIHCPDIKRASADDHHRVVLDEAVECAGSEECPTDLTCANNNEDTSQGIDTAAAADP
jgi:hypothetical protein